MTIYYYAYSGHKYGLDRVKRAVALIKALRTQGVEVNLLLNDFRAGLAARELGVMDSVTVETILDIDAVAKRGDVVFIDSPEDDRGKLEHYADEYRPLFRVVDDCGESASCGEILMKPVCGEEDCLSSLLVDSDYFEPVPKEKRRLFFLGDADYNKMILSHTDFFEGVGMELLLGQYFFVKYEDDLAKLFDGLHEAEEYSELLCSSSQIITASTQCAIEARAADADVVYLKKPEDAACLLEQFEIFGIKIIDGFDREQLMEAMGSSLNERKVPNSIESISEKIIKKLNL